MDAHDRDTVRPPMRFCGHSCENEYDQYPKCAQCGCYLGGSHAGPLHSWPLSMSNCRARSDDDGDLFYRTLRLVREVLAERAHWRIYISHQLWSHVDALPEPKQMVEGLTHYNIAAPETPLQAPVKAIASRKVYFFTRLEATVEAAASGGSKPENLNFNKNFPHDIVMEAGTGLTWFTKDLLNTHEGEARILGNTTWEKFAYRQSNFTVFNSRFWHYQFMKDQDTREWLLLRSRSSWAETALRPEDVVWILSKEKNETTYLKFKSASGESPRHKHDLSRGTFYFKRGYFVTLAEMFYFGCRVATCADLYDTYVHLPIFLYEQ